MLSALKNDIFDPDTQNQNVKSTNTTVLEKNFWKNFFLELYTFLDNQLCKYNGPLLFVCFYKIILEFKNPSSLSWKSFRRFYFGTLCIC